MEIMKTRQKLCKIEWLFSVGQEGKISAVKLTNRMQQNKHRFKKIKITIAWSSRRNGTEFLA